MEMIIFAVGLASFVYESIQWHKKRRSEPIVLPALLYVIGLALAWFSAKNAPIPSPAEWIVPAFRPVTDIVSFWLG